MELLVNDVNLTDKFQKAFQLRISKIFKEIL